jgi:hypothetical protein
LVTVIFIDHLPRFTPFYGAVGIADYLASPLIAAPAITLRKSEFAQRSAL